LALAAATLALQLSQSSASRALRAAAHLFWEED